MRLIRTDNENVIEFDCGTLVTRPDGVPGYVYRIVWGYGFGAEITIRWDDGDTWIINLANFMDAMREAGFRVEDE